jgi:hypothetical protein
MNLFNGYECMQFIFLPEEMVESAINYHTKSHIDLDKVKDTDIVCVKKR